MNSSLKEAVLQRPLPDCLTRSADSRIAGLYNPDKRNLPKNLLPPPLGSQSNFETKLQLPRNLQGNEGLERMKQLWFQFVRLGISAAALTESPPLI
ncbi:hypothetical protein RISK_002494 [Rhodopirellula islandica]|uniref:Uncharacterized protein n=1 Tax=Rhodopirellula islandica TaxID=595434 RepID=A0A0J1BH24_RHOIS|nr:hypothetical protein RISK_002494 [Rhodopirellula islandica]